LYHSNRGSKLFGETRKTRRSIQFSLGVIEDELTEGGNLKRGKHCAAIRETLMKRRCLNRLCVKELGPNGIQNPMAHFMANDVRTFTGEEGTPRHRLVKEVQTRGIAAPSSRVKGVKVYAAIELNRECITNLPLGSVRDNLRPEIGRPPQACCGGPEPEIRGTGLENLGWWSGSADFER
jgi:hypothetical protein